MNDQAADFLGIGVKQKPTERALNYAHSLLSKHESYGAVADAEKTNSIEAAHEMVNGMDKDDLSKFIDTMKAQPLRAQRSRSDAVQVDEGMYKMNGEIYKVQRAVHGSGHLYAKRLQKDGKQGTFVFEPGAINALRPEHKMAVSEAAAYGRLYEFCVVCGKTLTDDQSIAAGIGPICAGKEGRFAL